MFSLKKKYILIILIILSLISISRAFYQAQNLSYDLHLSPTKLVAEGENHYEYILAGKHDKSSKDKLLYSQDGVYSHGLFIILLPLTFLDWENAKLVWSILNIFFMLGILICFFKKFEISLQNQIIISAIIFCSTPFRLNIGYGQQTLFPILFLYLPFVYKNKLSYFLSGISYIKYNISYGLVLYLCSKIKIKYLIISSILPLLFCYIYSYKTNTDFFKSILQPLEVLIYYKSTWKNNFPVTIFSFLEIFKNNYISLLVPIFLNFFTINLVKNEKDDLYKLSLISLSILAFSSHQLHDYIILTPLLIYSILNIKKIISKINIFLIIYFFFLLRIYSIFFGTQPWEFPYGLFGYFNNFLVILVLIINIISYLKNNDRIK